MFSKCVFLCMIIIMVESHRNPKNRGWKNRLNHQPSAPATSIGTPPEDALKLQGTQLGLSISMSCFFSWKREGLNQLLWCEDHRRPICFHCFLVWHQQIECFRRHLLCVNQDNTGVSNLPVVQGFDDYEWVTWRTSTVASDSCEIFGVVGHGLSLDVGVVSSCFFRICCKG